jgi:hypothetical protein
MNRAALRGVPAVEKVLQALGDTAVPRPAVLAVVRRELSALRNEKRFLTDAVVAASRRAR